MATDTHYRKKLGNWGESYALDYLKDRGYTLLVQNFRTRNGEIDLIMQSGEQMVAVEVKTRKSKSYGIAEHSITRKKYLALQTAMQAYLDSLPMPVSGWQIDLVVIETSPSSRKPEIIHYENVYLDYLDE